MPRNQQFTPAIHGQDRLPFTVLGVGYKFADFWGGCEVLMPEQPAQESAARATLGRDAF